MIVAPVAPVSRIVAFSTGVVTSGTGSFVMLTFTCCWFGWPGALTTVTWPGANA